jgi:hypothetical protein
MRLTTTVLSALGAMLFAAPVLAACPVSIDAARAIGVSTSGASTVYGLTFAMAQTKLDSLHLRIDDLDAHLQQVISVPALTAVSDSAPGAQKAFVAFGWRAAKQFSVSVLDVTTDGKTIQCEDNGTVGDISGTGRLDADAAWDSWQHDGKPVADASAYRAALATRFAMFDPSLIHGLASAYCDLLLHIDASGVLTDVEKVSSSGSEAYNAVCMSSAHADSFKPAIFNGTSFASTLNLNFSVRYSGDGTDQTQARMY